MPASRIGLALLVALVASTGPATARGQSGGAGDLDAASRATAISKMTNSPFCPGMTLDSCTSSRAAEWRRDIHDWAQEGLGSDEIRARLQTRVDELKQRGMIEQSFELSNRPPDTGPAFVAVGVLSLVALALVARRLVGRKDAAPAASPAGAARASAPGGTAAAGTSTAAGASRPPRDALDDALDEELRRLDG